MLVKAFILTVRVLQTLMPVITQFKPEVRLPFQCPLHPLRDVYGLVELSKLNYRVNLWTCSQCGKSFTGELELETHIHGRHSSLWDRTDFTVCLAEWCDVLRCDLQEGRGILRRPWPVRQSHHSRETSQLARAPSRELVALLESSDTGQELQVRPGRVRLRRPQNSTQCKDCSFR